MKNLGSVTNPKDVATKEYVDGAIRSPATATPLSDGTASIGSSAKYAREDHVHPTDTSRQAAVEVVNLVS